MIVEQADGDNIAQGRTPFPSPDAPINTVNVQGVPLSSRAPDGDDQVVAQVTVPATGVYSIEGIVQAFDFDD